MMSRSFFGGGYLARADCNVGLDGDIGAVPHLDDTCGDPGAGGQRDDAVLAALDLELDDRAALAECEVAAGVGLVQTRGWKGKQRSKMIKK